MIDDNDKGLNPWQSVKVAAKLAGLSKSTIYRWIRQDHIRARQGDKLEVWVAEFVPHWQLALIHYKQMEGK